MDENGPGPSIQSSDAYERKLARRQRIQRRLEAKIKEVGEQGEQVVEKSAVEKQIAESISLLENLTGEGNEVVTSVQIANDARELQRRCEEKEIRRRLLEKLEEDDKECTERYKEITEKWPSILSSNDPLDIHAEMAAQNNKCLAVLAKKDALIEELKEELEKADLLFEEDLKKQNEDIDLLIERMENQAQGMAKAYRQELMMIDNVIESERRALLDSAVEQWEGYYQKIQDGGKESLEKRRAIMREYEEGMQKAITLHQEEFRAQKIKYELEIQKLQQEIEKMKTLCLMNIEKLDYNYAVLKAREDENSIIRNQQKRKINKLQDVINDLRKDYKKLEESSKLEIQKLTEQVLKAHKGILDIQGKADQYAIIEDRKFMQIWDLNAKTANQLLDKILTADRVIHEQILNVEWQAPEVELIKKEDLPSYRSAKQAIKRERESARKVTIPSKPATSLEDINLERKLLNHILRQICDQCGYLLEDSLQELLSQYTENNRLIIRLDNAFQALGITSVEELHFILDFFLPYAYCPICTNKSSTSTSDNSDWLYPSEPCPAKAASVDTSGGHTEDSVSADAKVLNLVKKAIHEEECENQCFNDTCVPIPSTTPRSFVTNTSTNEENEISSMSIAAESSQSSSSQGELDKRKLTCPNGHSLEIETASVSKALIEFVEKYEFIKRDNEAPDLKERAGKDKVTISRCITDEDLSKFWHRYKEVFSEEKEKTWDVLVVGLKKYYEALKERHVLNVETESLQRQNQELKRLLKTCKPERNDTTQDEMTENRELLQIENTIWG